MALSSQLSARLAAVAKRWPGDPFRPNMQLGRLWESLAKQPNLSERAVVAAEGLATNAILTRYPLNPKLARPASYPEHYKALLIGMEKSAQGIKRPWWKILLGKY